MPSPVTPWLEGFKCVQICMRVVFHQMKNGFPSLCAFSINSIVLLAAYRAPNENCGLVAVTFLGCFQTDNMHEVVQRLNHRSISSVEGGDLFSGNGLVRGKGLQDGGCQWGINLFIKLQENQADLITVREEPVAAGMSDLFD